MAPRFAFNPISGGEQVAAQGSMVPYTPPPAQAAPALLAPPARSAPQPSVNAPGGLYKPNVSLLAPPPIPSAGSAMYSAYPPVGANLTMPAGGQGYVDAVAANPPSQTAAKTSTGLGAASTLLAFVPYVGPVLSGLAAVGSVIASWWGMGEAEKAQKKAADEEKRRYEAESRKEEARYAEGMALTRTKMAIEARAEQEAGLRDTQKIMAQERAINKEYEYKDKELAETAKTNRINQASTMVAGMLRFANSPENRAAYAQIWRR